MAAFAAAAVAVTPSCTKTVQPDSFNQEVTLQEMDALEEFASVLSKVVAGSEEVRAFFKEEALKQFDRDYDVFYPYVKDHKFSSGKTLRQMLLDNEKYEGQIETIERAVPKLTVLVPDFSWLDEEFFCAEKWDTSIDRLCVGFDDDAAAHRLYFDGEFQDVLPASNIPAFPVLIVKSNERMKVSVSTKGGENTYSFADSAFDGAAYAAATKAGHWEGSSTNGSIREDLVSVTGNFVAKEELDGLNPDIIRAYKEFSTGGTRGVQRDYIYYGMEDRDPHPGVLNRHMRDLLYRFTLTPDGLNFISDDSRDPDLTSTLSTGHNDRPDFSHAVNRIWGNGKYEMRLRFYQAYPNNGAACIGTIALSIAPGDIMRVNELTWTHDANFWGTNKSTYKIVLSSIESKWYYPGDKNNPLALINTTWNLAEASDNIFMRVTEFDENGSETVKAGRTFKYSWSVSANVSGEFGISDAIKIGLGVSGEYGQEEVDTKEYTYTKSTGEDDLLDCEICYIDSYIIAPAKLGAKTGYQMKTWGNEYFSVSFIPVDMRNEAEIKSFLFGRRNRNNNNIY